MESQFLISDVRLIPVRGDGGRLVLLRDEDHLLRRFGQLEAVRLVSNQTTAYTYRQAADELWCVLDGKVQFTLADRREQSPSKGETVQVWLEGGAPAALLVPFGVAYSLEAATDTLAIRMTTHADGVHPGDGELAVEEFTKEINTL